MYVNKSHGRNDSCSNDGDVLLLRNGAGGFDN